MGGGGERAKREGGKVANKLIKHLKGFKTVVYSKALGESVFYLYIFLFYVITNLGNNDKLRNIKIHYAKLIIYHACYIACL